MAVQSVIRSSFPGMVWPAIPLGLDATLLALQFQLERSQWLSPDEITRLQFIQAKELLKHAFATVPYYQQHLPPDLLADDRGIDWKLWRSIPILQRQDIQQFSEELVSKAIPPSHLPIQAGLTSGSTGRPLHSMKTAATGLMWHACALRGRLWHQHDVSAKLAGIKALEKNVALAPDGMRFASWGADSDMFLPHGQVVLLNVRSSVDEQLSWLKKEQPEYLVAYPSNLAALAEACLAKNIKLTKLKGISSLGEKLMPTQRELCNRAWGVAIQDTYSAEEAGYMAIQCPTGEHYHVQAEHVLLEVLDENGRACQPGQIGRVVITTLNNFAKPFIRYAIGDYAEVGSPCACGRGLPVLKEIMGRTRNMFVRPDGQTFWPVMPNPGKEFIAKMPAVRQYQYVQKSPEWIEIRIAIENAPYPADVEAAIIKALQKEYGYPFHITFAYMKEIPTSGRGKYEEFMSELTSETES